MAMEHEFQLTVDIYKTSLDAKTVTFPNAEPRDSLFDLMAECVQEEEIEKYEMQVKGKV